MEKKVLKKMREIWSRPASTETPFVIMKALERASREHDVSWLQAKESEQAIVIANRAIELMEEEAARLTEVIEVLREHPEAIYYRE